MLPRPPSRKTRFTVAAPSRRAVSSSWTLIRKPPSPLRVTTRRSGSWSFAAMPPGTAIPMEARPFEIRTVLGLNGRKKRPSHSLWAPTSEMRRSSGSRWSRKSHTIRFGVEDRSERSPSSAVSLLTAASRLRRGHSEGRGQRVDVHDPSVASRVPRSRIVLHEIEADAHDEVGFVEPRELVVSGEDSDREQAHGGRPRDRPLAHERVRDRDLKVLRELREFTRRAAT